MDQKPLSPLQEKSGFVAPQQDAEMMSLIQRKGKPTLDPQVEKFKNHVKTFLQKNKIPPQTMIRAGQMAEMAIMNPAMFPAMAQMAVKEGLLPQEKLGTGVNYPFLAAIVAAGKVSQMIAEEGGA